DLIIVGGGPAALALVTRLIEDAPASLYTDQEHAMLVWLQNRPGSSPALRIKGKNKTMGHKAALAANARDFRILVVDRIGQGWLGAWDRNFKELHITHLRSPMFFHPCPADLDALLGYASAHGKPEDLSEIPEVVGREQSKHQRKRQRAGKRSSGMALAPEAVINERAREDYFAPSATLFRQFVRDECERRYAGVSGQWCDAQDALGVDASTPEPGELTLVRGEACGLVWDDDEKLFGVDIRGRNGESFPLAARAVVYAGGNGGAPSIPDAIRGADDAGETKPQVDHCRPPTSGPGWTHTFAMGGNPEFGFPSPPDGKGTGTLVVVGGGLSSAQIVERALDEGWSRVVLLLRGYLKVKPFDIGLEWMGKYKNLHKMMFWQEPSPVDRLQRIRAARNGGSMPAYASRRLRALAEEGHITIHTHTVISHAERDDANGWKLELLTTCPDSCTSTQDLEAQHIFLATGVVLKFPFADAPGLPARPLYGGLPALTEDLQWAPGVPLFAVGPYCALQVGPAAFNLGGMREAADRVATRLAEL
ncbi:hypothetical protein AURDEDRAFT_47977, partial [Auricularia subglabra TFB-10046 SS5]